MTDPAYWNDQLKFRSENSSLRSLDALKFTVDFFSNDYLGFARDPEISEAAAMLLHDHAALMNGATGSRLLSGNSGLAMLAEQELAEFYRSPAALIFNSGADANTGLLSCIATRHDTIIYDALAHASIRDGIRLSNAASYAFLHNDMNDLRNKIAKAKGNVFVVTESVFSMDGDLAPLHEIVALVKKTGAFLVVDEAHAVGVFGTEGEGLVASCGLENDVAARVSTFGKAFGIQGAAVLGSKTLIDYLVNFSRSFIYTTALPPYAYAAVIAAHRKMKNASAARGKLHALIRHFASVTNRIPFSVSGGESPVKGIVVPGNREVRTMAARLQSKGYGIKPVLSPTVPEGKERLRISLHAFNTTAEIDSLIPDLRNE